MRDLLEQIKKGLDANLFFLALFTALTIPDICGALSSDNGEASGQKYQDWFDQYVSKKYNNFFNGQNCYYFRCSLLHQGTSQHNKSNYSRILFVEPSVINLIAHNNIMNDALNIDIKIFCKDIIAGAEEYLAENEETELYKINYDKFVHRYPNGLSPYIIGVPVFS